VTNKIKTIDIKENPKINLNLLQAGAVVTIEINTPAGQRGKFRTSFVGFLPKQYVLVQTPSPERLGRMALHIKQGTNVTVRGLVEGHRGAVVAFTSQIKQTVQMPSRLIVLDFPEQVILQSLRHSIRIDIEIDAIVTVNKERWKASISDISISGCLLFVHNGEKLVLTNDSEIEIVIEQFMNLYELTFKAIICNVKPMASGISLGVKFVDESKADVKKLLLTAITSEG
jgi:c-di-GMP-binding flagellar brake protein YcgR